MRKIKTGVAFPDYISSDNYNLPRRRFEGGSNNPIRWYILPFLGTLLLIFLLSKLLSLQIIKGGYYRKLSDNNRTKTIIVHAPRGIIFDRNGVPLVFNIPGFRKTDNGKTQVLSRDEALTLLSKNDKSLEIDSLRQYPYAEALSHVIGYIGQISKNELKSPAFSGYVSGELIGKTGIEQEYEGILKGEDGKELFEVDSMGRQVRKLGQTDPVAGKDIALTLDASLQKVAYEALKGVKKGAVIVSTPKGEILAMVSKPSFDPNLFTLGKDYKTSTESAYQDISSVLSDGQDQPLLNRAISGTYPPGSTFKLVVAAAGLQDKIIDENYVVQDSGVLNVGAFSFSNWYFTQYGKTEGEVSIVKGIKRSNDIFFYKLAEKIGVDTISKMGANFGLGKTLGIDLAGEQAGVLPTTQWKEKVIGEPWYLGDTYHYGIGQGYALTTPLQVNGWTQALANEGVLYEPHLLKNTTNITNTTNKQISQKFLSEKTVDLVREGMVEACSTGGVAWPFFEFRVKNSKLKIDGKNFLEVPEASTSAGFADFRKVAIACKTGTAQHGGESTLPHAWITLFAPAYNPQIVVTVLSESSGEGSNIAAPIAKQIVEEWFSR